MSRTTVRTPVVEFSRSAGTPDGDVVHRKGVIFRAGSYPTQAFAMTPDELKALAASFEGPIPLDHGHPSTDGPIDFGRLVGVEASPDGTTLFGRIEAPAWLDQAMAGAKAWRVSASFDRATKAIRRLSLVTRPQISDAELQAAFACACGGDHAKAEETTPMDDWKADVNAALEALDPDERSAVIAALKAPPDDDLYDYDEDEMDDTDDDDIDIDEADTSPSDFASADFADEAASLRAEVEALKAERRRERAAAFAAEMKQQGRIAPFEEPCTAAVMFSAMSDDNDIGDTVDFAVGPKATRGSREQMVRAAYAQRIPHAHAAAGRDPADFARGGYRTLDNGGSEETPEQKRARLDARLANTSTGRGILARRGQG